MPREARSAAQDFDKLKSLLIGAEADSLAVLARKVDTLENYIGEAPRLEIATADIIAQALRRAEIARHRELANAIAPLIVSVIRAEIRNSRDMMVEALYPITGRLVAAAVSNAFRELIARLNQRIDKLTSAGSLKLRARALLTGKSASELALAEAHRGRITRILFIERGSGTLIASWQTDGIESENPELESGLIAAITEFAANALNAQGGELRTVDLGATQVILRASPRIIVAANCDGRLLPRQEAALDTAFLRLIERFDQDEAIEPAGLADVAAMVDARGNEAAPRTSGVALKMIAGAIAALLLWWIGARYLEARSDANLRERFAAALAGDRVLAAYPLTLSIVGRSGPVTITGLAPDAVRVEALAETLRAAASPRSVVVAVAAIPDTAALAEQDAKLRALAARQRDGEAQDAALRRQLHDDISRLDAASRVQALAVVDVDDRARAADGAATARLDATDATLAKLSAALQELRASSGQLQGEVSAISPRLLELSAGLRTQSASLKAAMARREDVAAAILRGQAQLRARQQQLRDGLDTLATALPDVEARALDEAAKTLEDQQDQAAGAEAQLNTARLSLDTLAGTVSRGAEALDALTARIDVAEVGRAAFGARIETLEKSVAALATRGPSAQERLKALVAALSFRFVRDNVLDDSARSGMAADELASLLRDTGARLRIIGHTDESGTAAANLQIGQRRATLIAQMLTARGVDESRLTVVVDGAPQANGDAALGSPLRFRGATLELSSKTESP